MSSPATYPSLPHPHPPTTATDEGRRGEIPAPSPTPHRRPPARRVYVRHPKPPQTYVELIGEALESSPSGALTLGGISEYLRGKYIFFRGPYQGWRNSVRHNLSLNQCFKKILRDPHRPYAKDNLWTLDPRHLPRAPHPRPTPPPPHDPTDQGRLLGVLFGGVPRPYPPVLLPQALFTLWSEPAKVPAPPVSRRPRVKGFTVEDILGSAQQSSSHTGSEET